MRAKLIEWTNAPEPADEERPAFHEKWEPLFDIDVAADPETWWNAAAGLALVASDDQTIRRLSLMPMRQLRDAIGEQFIPRAIEAARRDPERHLQPYSSGRGVSPAVDTSRT